MVYFHTKWDVKKQGQLVCVPLIRYVNLQRISRKVLPRTGQ